MPHYRLYHMSPRDGHIASFDEFDAVSDDAAETFAANKLNAHPMELWQQHRKVRRFEPYVTGNHVADLWSKQSD